MASSISVIKSTTDWPRARSSMCQKSQKYSHCELKKKLRLLEVSFVFLFGALLVMLSSQMCLSFSNKPSIQKKTRS